MGLIFIVMVWAQFYIQFLCTLFWGFKCPNLRIHPASPKDVSLETNIKYPLVS